MANDKQTKNLKKNERKHNNESKNYLEVAGKVCW